MTSAKWYIQGRVAIIVGKYFEDRLITSVNFKVKMSNLK